MAVAEKQDRDWGVGLSLLAYFNRETAGVRFRIVASSLIVGLSRGALLATFNGAAAAGTTGRFDAGLIAAFAVAMIAYLVTSYDSGRQSVRAVRGMIQRLRMRICEKLLSSQLRVVERQGAGRIYNQIGSDIEQLANGGVTFLSSFRSALILVVTLIYLGWLSIPGFLAGVLVIGFSSASYIWQKRRASRMLQQARDKEDVFYDAVYDLLHGFKELKLNRAQQADLATHLKTIADEYRVLSIRAGDLYLKSTLTSDAFTFGLIAILVFLLPVVFPSSSAYVFQFLSTVLFALAPAEQMIASIPLLTRAGIALGRIERLEQSLDADFAASDFRDRDMTAMTFQSIALNGVHYHFTADKPEECFALGPIDLELRRGETLFICGGNGAGKTTLLKLLTGLYQPTAGKLSVDGKEVGAKDYQRYREMFGAVFGDFYLFQRLYGLQDPDPDSVEELLTMLQIREKTRLKNGAFTTINLSSGQRKRLAYAISRLNDRQIYVFDEFAADQDPGFRRYFYAELLPELKRQGKTVVAVTHDERWFEAGDRLVKLDYGTISASGTVVSGQTGNA